MTSIMESFIQDNKVIEVMVYNFEISIKRKFEQCKMEGELEGELKGKMEGEIKGKMEAKIEIARKMLIKGMDIRDIADFTGLDAGEVEKLRSETSNH